MVHDDVRQYIIELLDARNLAEGTVNQAISVLRLLYTDLYHRPEVTESLPRPSKGQRFPDVPSELEVTRLFRAVENLKHRMMLMLAYACGLRVGELVRLRIEDMDGERGLIHIRDAKWNRYSLHSGATGTSESEDNGDLHTH